MRWILVVAANFATTATAQDAGRIEDYLQAHASRDAVVQRAVQEVGSVLPGLLKPAWTSAKGVRLFVTDFRDLPARFYPYRTETCLAAHSRDNTPLIVCNEAFLLETEIVVRAFEDASDLMVREAALNSFVRRTQANKAAALSRLREDKKLAAETDQSAQHIGLHMKMALLFFASHELGHLVKGSDFGAFSEPPKPAAPDAEVRAAVLRSCRQADEFNRFEFGLPGLQALLKTGSDARQVEQELRAEVVEVHEATVKRFADEEAADQVSVEIMLAYLNAVEKASNAQALEEQHLFMETLFAIAIYRWHSDLIAFADATCGQLKDSRELAMCMMQSRQRYVAASKVFGEFHRFIYLRAVLAMDEVARQRMRHFDGTARERSIWADETILKRGGAPGLYEMWRAGDLQRLWLLRIMMDTPVKFSYTACLTGWFLEVDRKRGTPQLFMMFFEPIEQAIGRLKQLP